MGFFIANRRKIVLVATAVVLLIVYLCNVWINIKGIWRVESDSLFESCETIFLKKISNNTTHNDARDQQSVILKNRKKYLYEKCTSAPSAVRKQPLLLVSENHNMLICSLPNSAYEPLLSSGIKMTDFTPKEDVDPSLVCHTNYTSVLIVQHPVERLMRIFRNKKLIQHHVNNGNLLMEKDSDASFQTFEFFLEYIVKHYDMNDRWGSLHEQCQPCKVHYDLILKQGADLSDAKYLYTLLNLSFEKAVEKTYKFNHQIVRDSVLKFMKDSKNYDLLKDIKNLYRYDYDLFGYSSVVHD